MSATQTTTTNPFKEGDVLCMKWGSSMVLIQFFEVTRVTKTCVGLRELEQKRVGNQQGYASPVPGQYKEPDGCAYNVHPDKLYTVKQYIDEAVVRIPAWPGEKDFSNARKWSGKEVWFNECD